VSDTRPKCPKCDKDFATEGSLKVHLSNMHGGYSVDDLKQAGIKPTRRDIARNLAGNESAKDVTSNAPESEGPAGGASEPQRRTRKSKQAVDPDVEAAKDRILRARCERVASLPYSLLASLTGEEDIRLDATERADITEAYVTLSKSYGWEATARWILWGDVMIATAMPFASPKRRAALGRVAGLSNNQDENEEKGEVIQ